METAKAHARRERQGFFTKYVHEPVIDIGCGRVRSPSGSAHGTDLVVPSAMAWDQDDGDATFMRPEDLRKHPQWREEMEGGFGLVHSSHCLEHISNPYLALMNWWRLVGPGGFLALLVPHRDLYEKRTTLPSRWNPDHKFFFLPYENDEPYTLSLMQLVYGVTALDGYVKHVHVCDEGHTITDPEQHSDGEYSIEVVVQKKAWELVTD